MSKLHIASIFFGIGGIYLRFKQSECEIIVANKTELNTKIAEAEILVQNDYTESR